MRKPVDRGGVSDYVVDHTVPPPTEADDDSKVADRPEEQWP